MMAGICEGIERALLEDKKGKMFEMPKISESNHEIFYDDCIGADYDRLKKYVFKYSQYWHVGFFMNDQKKIARKLNLYKKLKFIPQKQKSNVHCQREIEGETKCKEQCEHCIDYYKDIDGDNF